MAITRQPSVNMVTKGAAMSNMAMFGTDLWELYAATTPTNGTSGDGAGFAGPGSRYTDTNGAKLYINTNTKASPTWTVVGAQTA